MCIGVDAHGSGLRSWLRRRVLGAFVRAALVARGPSGKGGRMDRGVVIPSIARSPRPPGQPATRRAEAFSRWEG
jgi:hypothetical protein